MQRLRPRIVVAVGGDAVETIGRAIVPDLPHVGVEKLTGSCFLSPTQDCAVVPTIHITGARSNVWTKEGVIVAVANALGIAAATLDGTIGR